MKTYTELFKDKVRKSADIRNYIPGIKRIGNSYFCQCPVCREDKKGKGLKVTHNSRMDFAKCFSCGFDIKGAVGAVMYFQNKSYPDALEAVANDCGIPIETEEEQGEKKVKKRNESLKGSFVLKQLEASGLTIEDTLAKVVDEKSGEKIIIPTFARGGVDRKFNINHDDDEMLIYYYDIFGKPVKYSTRGAAGGLKSLVRVRWSNPAAHVNSEGKEIKYQTPWGAEARFYIPEIIRECFTKGQEIKTLIIQEGEKKALKACKHGILSIGIQGIFNIGNKETGLIKDLQYIVQKCQVRNIVLLFDSDWDDLSKNLKDKDDVDQRPLQFARAAMKFRTYVETLNNSDCSVDVWCGHLKTEDKGIDDLLAKELKGRESDLKKDIDNVILSHDGIGEFCDIYKISTKSDYQILDLWGLRNAETFFESHRDRLLSLKRFKFAKVNYTVEDGKFRKSSSGKDFWKVKTKEDGERKAEIDYLEAFAFLEANGFCKIHTADLGVDEFKFANIERGIIKIVGGERIRDYTYRFVMQNCKDIEVMQMMAANVSKLLSNERLQRLKEVEDNFSHKEPMRQERRYSNGMVTITPEVVEFGQSLGICWDSRVLKRDFKRVPIFSKFDKIGNDFDWVITPEGEKCEFLKFIINTSNFWKGVEETMKDADHDEWIQHIVNKITAMGYLLTEFKYPNESKAIVLNDTKMADVDDANGGTGKSLFGVAISNIVNQAFIDGNQLKNDDEFMFSLVTPESQNVIIDDIQKNFNFKKLFSALTGHMLINPKGGKRFKIDFADSPKIMLTTNYAISNFVRSTKRRIVFMGISDYYNLEYTPYDDFGHNMFLEWDREQWNLFDNLMAECVMIYMRSMQKGWADSKGCGIVKPPMADLMARQLRLKMGEEFLQWAMIYFDPSAGHLGVRLDRKELIEDFFKEYPQARRYVTTSSFRERILAFCEFNGMHFNPRKRNGAGKDFKTWRNNPDTEFFLGGRDISNGHDYFTIISDNEDETANENKPF